VHSTVLRAITAAVIGGGVTVSLACASLFAEAAAHDARGPTLVASATGTRPAASGQTGQRPPAKPKPRTAAAAPRPSLEIEVTDPAGAPLEAVAIGVSGPVEREGRTGQDGVLRLANLRPGTYRLRFEHDGYVVFEREVTLPAATRPVVVDVTLTAVPEAPRPDPAPEAPPPDSPAPPPRGAVRVLDVPAFIERHFIGRGEPQRLSTLGCAGQATTRLLQIREPLEDVDHEEADVTLYALAGEGTLAVDGRTQALNPGTLAVIPRGTRYSVSRRGRNPLVVMSVLSGPPCAEDVPP
jgi:mannose-6-phosphate isomerase-like protein (cupin superfamily)